MTDKVSKFPVKPKQTYLVFVPGERNPTFVDASEHKWLANEIDGRPLLQLSHNGRVIAVFNRWDYFECVPSESSAEGAA